MIEATWIQIKHNLIVKLRFRFNRFSPIFLYFIKHYADDDPLASEHVAVKINTHNVMLTVLRRNRKIAKSAISFIMSVRLSMSAPTGRIFMKFDI